MSEIRRSLGWKSIGKLIEQEPNYHLVMDGEEGVTSTVQQRKVSPFLG